MNDPRPSQFLKPFLAFGRRPGLVLVVAAIVAFLSISAASRSQLNASIQDLLGIRDPAAAALGHLMDDFSSTEELLVLATVDDGADSTAGTNSAREHEVARLMGFAEKLSAALKQSSATAPFCGQISYSASLEFMEFFTREAVPAGLLYLDESEYQAFLERLTPESMRRQLLQDESMMSAPGGNALTNVLMKDPLRLRDFLESRLTGQSDAFRTFGGRSEFVSSDGKSILIRVAGVRPPSDLEFAKMMTARVGEVARAISSPGLRVDLAGAYAIATASERAIRADLVSTVTWSLVIMQAVFLIGYRSLLSFAIAFIPVALGLAMAFGFHALLSTGFTPLTAAIGAILVGCGIDYPIYFLSFFESARARGLRAIDAGSSAMASLAVPLTAACATSVAGFAAIAVSGVQALRDFAFLGGMGLLFVLLATICVLPAVLTLADRAGVWGGAGPRRGIEPVIRTICSRPRFFIGCCVFVTAGAAISLLATRGIHFETDLRVMHPSPNPPLETQEIIGKKFGAADSMIVYIQAPTGPELVSRAYQAQRALRSPQTAAAGISGSFGLPSLLPDPAALPGRVAEMKRIDPDKVIADFDAAVGESIFEPRALAPFKDFLRILLTRTQGPTLETLSRYPALRNLLVSNSRDGPLAAVTVLSLDSETLREVSHDATIVIAREALKKAPGAVLTGLGVVGYDVSRSVRQDLPVMTMMALVTIVVFLLVALRSIRDAALALIPVAFGILCLLGYMSIAREQFNLANGLAIPLLLGIGVDYGIFVVRMAQQSRLAGEGPEGLPTRLAASLHAMLLSAATNVVGFGTLAFTSVPAVQSLGKVIAVGVVACVAGTLLLLTPVLVLSAFQRARKF
ncbi:MAG: efflux RND transporter permease subunit [Phycisphaerales bacterium]